MQHLEPSLEYMSATVPVGKVMALSFSNSAVMPQAPVRARMCQHEPYGDLVPACGELTRHDSTHHARSWLFFPADPDSGHGQASSTLGCPGLDILIVFPKS